MTNFIKFKLLRRIHFGMNNIITNKYGVSLIELMIASVILALIMLPVFLAFSSGNRNLKVTSAEFMAHTAALELMEQIVSLPYDKIPLGIFENDKIQKGKYMGNSGITFNVTSRKNCKSKIILESIDKNGKTKFKKVSILIEFPETAFSTKNRTINLKTLVANEKI